MRAPCGQPRNLLKLANSHGYRKPLLTELRRCLGFCSKSPAPAHQIRVSSRPVPPAIATEMNGRPLNVYCACERRPTRRPGASLVLDKVGGGMVRPRANPGSR